MISVKDINVFYGDLQALWDVSIEVQAEDSVVGIVGPNGAGKSTLLSAIAGILHPDSGTITINGEVVTGAPAYEIVQRGFVLVPERRNLFNEMSVLENLKMGAYRKRENYTERVEQVYELFPVLKEKRDQQAGTLSGGQRQMLAIGRGLTADPDIIALDEPSAALDPQLTQRVFEAIEAVAEETQVLLVEQHVHRTLELSERAYLLEQGQIVQEATGDELLESEHVQDSYFAEPGST